jgi:hypothetical protein
MGAARARLTLKLISMCVFLALTVIGARSCSGGGGGSSPLQPGNLARNGVSALCANQQAAAAAAGEGQPGQLALPAGDSALAEAAGLTSRSLACAPTTTQAP